MAIYFVWNLEQLLTLVNSGCKCPSMGKADAFKILGEQFDGPGPIRSFCGMTIGLKRLSEGAKTELMLNFWTNDPFLDFWIIELRTFPVRGRIIIRSDSMLKQISNFHRYTVSNEGKMIQFSIYSDYIYYLFSCRSR